MSSGPRSFGRAREEEPVQAPEQSGPAMVSGGLRVVDGKLLLDVEVNLLVTDEVLQGVYDQVREVIALAAADGLTAAAGLRLRGVDEVLGEPEPEPVVGEKPA